MERRGLVELGNHCFHPEAVVADNPFGARMVWSYINPNEYVPGEMRMMTGVMLLGAGCGRESNGQGELGHTA